MDCRSFRNHHLAYLDDTLSGELMTAAQRHILSCDRCAAHDTLVRRSLLLARNIPKLEPSPEFKARLRSKIDECRQMDAYPPLPIDRNGFVSRRTFGTMAIVAALGTAAWSAMTPTDTPLVAMQPVVATQPAIPDAPYVSAALMQAMATGNPVWPAAMILDEVPTQFVNASYSFGESEGFR